MVKEFQSNKSLVYGVSPKMRVQSPQYIKKPMDGALKKSSLNVMNSPKDKLKRSIFKVKDPERFDRLIKTLEAGSAENIDFTGLELGNEITKELCQKLKGAKKVKSVRLMKNLLNDDLLPALLTLTHLEVINLAQNSFTVKAIDMLLEHCKNTPPEERPKNIQLGHNNINTRKCREKVEEIKQYGVTISL